MFYLSLYRDIRGSDDIHRRDARRIPDIKHVDNPYTLCPPRPAQSDVHSLSEPTGNVEAPSPLPSKEWRSKFEHRFRNFRGVSLRSLFRPCVRAHPL
jgi:survival motor neuron (SMN) interacting protein 1 (SIP1)